MCAPLRLTRHPPSAIVDRHAGSSPRGYVMSGDLGPIPLPDPGEKRSGFFTFAADPLLARYEWPYFSIAGATAGPTFLITAGIHAAEYTGIAAAIRLGRTLDPAQIAGRIIIAP